MSLFSRLFPRKAPHTPLDRSAFQERIRTRLGESGLPTTVPAGSGFLLVDSHGRQFQLENLYRAYSRNPSEAAFLRMAELALDSLHEMEEGPASAHALSGDEILSRVLPIIRPLSTLQKLGEPVTRLNEELGVFLAWDSEHSMTYLDAHALEKAGLFQGTAYARALANLRARSQEPRLGKLKEADVYFGNWDDDYDSSRLLLRELYSHFPEIRKVRVAVPARSCLLFWDARDEQAQAAALPLVEQLYQSEPGPLSPRPFDL